MLLLKFNRLIFVVLLIACEPSPAAAQFADSQVIVKGDQGDSRVRVELARSQNEMARGLMYRQQLDEDAGMLFIYQQDGDHHFWMKNTYLPLDMVFLGADGKVVGIVENAEPMTTTSRSVNTPSRYVLEVNAGYCRRHGVRNGTRVEFFGISGL